MKPKIDGIEDGRRSFLRALALGTSAGILPAAESVAQDEPPKPPAADYDEAAARLRLISSRFGDHLDDAAREEVKKQVEGVVRQGEALRKFALENGDEPFTVFRPFRAPLA